MTNSTPSWLDVLRAGRKAGRDPNDLLRTLPSIFREAIDKEWQIDGRPDQMPPEGDWLVWLILAGRGSGKTRAGAQWVRGMALGLPPFTTKAVGPIALVGETFADVREVMIEGVSGLMSRHESFDRPTWQPSRRRLVWSNGNVAQAFSSEDPEGLRGPQFAAAWCDAALPAPIGEWSGWIISAIFLSESGERITRTIVHGRSP